MKAKIHLSVVSHGQGEMVGHLLDDLRILAQTDDICVTLTLNVEEILPFDPGAFPFPIQVVENSIPKGFGANHNAAFYKFQNDSAYFCVVNPDIRVRGRVFEHLLGCIEQEGKAGVVAPLVRSSLGEIEDSARPLPTPWIILTKVFGLERKAPLPAVECGSVDWVAGMFMLFPRGIFERLGGFDRRYFLYYEDVDLCCRLYLGGYKVLLSSLAEVEHDAQRASHKKLKYFLWHCRSLSRFFLSPIFFRRWRQIQRASLGMAEGE